MPLTNKQARFVAEYAKDGNGTRSAIAAGYAESSAHVTAYDLLRNPKIVAELDAVHATALQRVQALQDEAIGSAEWIIRNAVETHNEARENGQYGPAISALALLAKRFPEFRESITVDNRTQTIQLPEGTSLDDLRALRDGLR
jgi:phage terminase small subunit